MSLGLSFEPRDFIENVIGFLPIGVAFANLGLVRAVLWAALLSACAETAQFGMAHRDPSLFDVLANVVGGVLGVLLWRAASSKPPALAISNPLAVAAFFGALAMPLGIWSDAGALRSTRGGTTPGVLEARWSFGEAAGRVGRDSSGHNLDVDIHQVAVLRPPGILGSALRISGPGDYAAAPISSDLRLEGSMTVSAWIQSASFPDDDAAIVSQLGNGFGFQLDTTIDKGPRTIGFKLTNSCGDLMARYGSTPLKKGKWDHVAGVYDAQAGSLDVYLNAELDNGVLVGRVTHGQRSSRFRLFLGRRSDEMGYAFSGLLDDIRIYSFALTRSQIAAVMRGRDIASPAALTPPTSQDPECAIFSEPDDGRSPAAAAVFGVLLALACLHPRFPGALWVRMLCGAVAGVIFLPLMPGLPLLGRWIMVLASAAGSLSVFRSMQTDS